MSRYSYTAYGLNFESSFPLPELVPAPPEAPDVVIRYGEVPESLVRPTAHGIAWQSSAQKVLLTAGKVARYLVLGNHEIRVQPLPGSSEPDIRIFLLGSVLGALLHARGMLVLHASVIETRRGAVLFMGKSGAGKSTILGAFLQRGYRMLADDKAGIVLDESGVPQVMPGMPFVRLKADAADNLNYPVNESQMRSCLQKYVFPAGQFRSEPVRLSAAYYLAGHNQPEIHLVRLRALDGFNALNRNTYRRRFIKATNTTQAHFKILKAASDHLKVVRVLRPEHPLLIDELRARIEEDMEHCA